MEETYRYVGKCLFCHLGDESKRGVLERIMVPGALFITKKGIDYKCALGEIGQDCIIPELFKRAYEASLVGRKAIIKRTPIA